MPNDDRFRPAVGATEKMPLWHGGSDTAMNTERRRSDYSLSARRTGWGLRPPVWYLQWQLNRVCADIERLERALANEFGLLETSPMHMEHEALVAERDRLRRRLGVVA